MATLILSMDGLVLKEIALSKERMTIGRKSRNDIQIDNPAISGDHAAIVTILKDSFLEDLGSTNGTLVNGQPVTKHFLRNNDVIEVGKYRLKYVNDPVAAIRLINGPNAGKELELTKDLTTLGKPGGQVAVIAKRAEGYFVSHVEGVQFPVLNGKILDAQAHALSDHDVIEIAGVEMEFLLKG